VLAARNDKVLIYLSTRNISNCQTCCKKGSDIYTKVYGTILR
jgi:hypothetical protein